MGSNQGKLKPSSSDKLKWLKRIGNKGIGSRENKGAQVWGFKLIKIRGYRARGNNSTRILGARKNKI